MNAPAREARPLPVVVLAGNPNVGKSTLFNRLTGMKQHTGNWPGKTVGSAWGRVEKDGWHFLLGDTPGTYSLLSHSAEEEAARDAICFGGADAVAVVCDATCLERGLNLVLQVLSLTARAVVCVNLMDEARRRGIRVDIAALEEALGVPVVGCAARDGAGVERLLRRVRAVAEGRETPKPREVRLAPDIEYGRDRIAAALEARPLALDARFVALRLLENDRGMAARLEEQLGMPLLRLRAVREETARLDPARVREESAAAIFARAERIFAACVQVRPGASSWQTRLDRLLTGRFTALPLMLLLLALVLYITIAGANGPSGLLFALFSRIEMAAAAGLAALDAPAWLTSLLCAGMLRALGWVVAVMLPPMAIFFPLFTLLEDVGYLPRVAFDLDRQFKRCHACGKQALTMCMGLGCNAAAGGGLPHHRQPAGAAHRHAHQRIHALQRAFPDDDRPHRSFPRARGSAGRSAAGGRDRAGRACDVRRFAPALSDAAARPALGVHAGIAALSPPAGGARDRPLGGGSHAARFGARRRRRCAGRAGHLAAGEHRRAWRHAALHLCALSRSRGALSRAGRGDPDGLFARAARQRAVSASDDAGLHFGRARFCKRKARRPWARFCGQTAGRG